MKAITDSTGAALTILSMSLSSGADSSVIVVRIAALAGQYLAADGDESAQVLARRTGTGSAFADIATAPISLTPYAGQTVEFDLKVHAGDITGLKRVAIPVRITYSP